MKNKHFCYRLIFLWLAFFTLKPAEAQFNKSSLSELQIGLSGIAYYTAPYFANALLIEGRNWMKLGTYDRFSKPGLYDQNGYPNWLPDTTGTYPKGTPLYMHPGQNAGSGRNMLFKGKFCLTWEGEGDIRLDGTFSASVPDANKPTGMMVNGKRYYVNGASSEPNGVRCIIYEINPANPPRNIRMWMPDPADPFNKTLEPASGQPEPVFHPKLIEKLSGDVFGVIRFMDWGNTNVNPVVYWKERRKPSFCSQTGSNFPERVVPGGSATNKGSNAGVSYEYMIELCNATGKDAWICVPHGATDGFIDSLAMLCAGMDPDNTGCPGLKPELKVYLEYSNEIWTPCDQRCRDGWFTQGCYAEDQKNAYNQKNGTNLSREQWIGRRFCEVWSIFLRRFGDQNRMVNVIATWTANVNNYTGKMLPEAVTFGPTLSPAVKPDVLAITTYFGNGIQNYIFDNINWQNPTSEELDKVYKEWELRILSSEANSTGKDFTGGGGGFGKEMVDFSKQYDIPLVAYEGGVSLNSDYSVYTLDCKIVSQTTPNAVFKYRLGNEAADACGGRTAYLDFIKLVQRDPRYGDMFYLSNSLAKAKGMYTPSQFGDIGRAGEVYGMWGCWETLEQPNSQSPKYTSLVNFYNDFKPLREINDSIGTKPRFTNAPELYPAREGKVYSQDLIITGGDGAIKIDTLGSMALPKGISLIYGNGKITLSGTPTESGIFRVAFRITDADNDYNLGIFTLRVLPAPQNKLFAYDDFGTAASIPLHGLNSGIGFKETWKGQNSTADFTIQNSQVFNHTTLLTSGSAYAGIGGKYETAGRGFDLSKFEYLVSSNNTSFIGQTGTTLWFSALVRRKTGAAKSDVFYLCNGTDAYVGNRRLVKIGVSSTGKWALNIKKSASEAWTQVESNATALENQDELIVVAVDFNQPYDQVRLFINPSSIGGTEPTQANATYSLTINDADLLLSAIGVYGASAKDNVWVDDLRFGETYAAVTPPKITDNQAPSVPTGFAFDQTTNDVLSLVWNTSTDNVGVSGYQVYKNGQLYVTVSDPTFMLMNPPINQNLQFYIKAIDFAGNTSEATTTLQISLTDTKAPTIPQDIRVTASTQNSLQLAWDASTDNVGVTQYKVYVNALAPQTVTACSFELSSMQQGVNYTIKVSACDAANNCSEQSTALVVNSNTDVEAPSAPQNLVASVVNSDELKLTWSESTDNKQVTGYRVYRNNTLLQTVTQPTITIANPAVLQTFSFYVLAIDASDNTSAPSNTINVPIPDTKAPSVPSNVQLTRLTNHSFEVTWQASSDNVAVTAYELWLNGIKLADCNDVQYEIKDLQPNLSYEVALRARDAAGNWSEKSEVVSIDLQALSTPNTLSNSWEVYPVPARETLNVRGNTTGNQVTFTLINASGISVQQFEFESQPLFSLPIQGIASGVYVLKIETAGLVSWKRVIIK